MVIIYNCSFMSFSIYTCITFVAESSLKGVKRLRNTVLLDMRTVLTLSYRACINFLRQRPIPCFESVSC